MNPSARVLGLWDSMAIIVGIVIGVGIFKVPAEIAREIPSAQWILWAWLAGGIISLLGCLCYAQLSALLPKTGGTYVYLRESYGPFLAFLYAWVELFLIRPGSIAAVSFIFAEAVISLFSLASMHLKTLAILSILILVLMNLRGLGTSKQIQSALAIVVVVILAGTVLCGIASQKGDTGYFLASGMKPGKEGMQHFALALIPILWTYGGWHENTFMGGETKDPSRVIPKALILALALITFLYLAINAVYLYLIPLAEMAESGLVISDVMAALFGASGGKIVDGLVILTSLGTMNGVLMTGSRMAQACFGDFRDFSSSAVLYFAVCFMGVLAVLMMVLGTFRSLLFFTGIFVWLFFAFVSVSVFILRRQGNFAKPSRLFLHPLAPALFFFLSAALFFNTLATYPAQSLIGFGLVLPAIPLYLTARRWKQSPG